MDGEDWMRECDMMIWEWGSEHIVDISYQEDIMDPVDRLTLEMLLFSQYK